MSSLLILLAVDELAFLAWLGDEVEQAFDERVGVGLRRLGGLFANVEYESKFAHGPAESAPPFPDLARTTTYPFTGPVWQESARDQVPGFLRARWTRAVAVGRQLFAFVHTFVSTS